MRCAACGHEVRAGAKFCDECGARLAAEAPSPRAAQPYTPRHLAERILTTRAALIGERKPVTVLFADVQGSMALAEQVDAEDWHAMMNRFFAILADGVHRFEGTVNQFTGDGIMALFGAPLAHEDHAQRACHAALHLTTTLRDYAQALRRERGLQFSVRMGLNSGEVVVGAIGDDLRMDYTAQGHTVGLAARMEQLCEPGHVYLTAATAALVEGFFDVEDLGAFTIKGVREPVRVYALAGPGRSRTRLDVSQARGLSRFVGRGDELAALDAALAAAGGGGTVVALSADAGVGKSRLCLELADRVRRRGGRVAHAVALAHGASVPYLPILELLRDLAGIADRDPPAAVRQKLAGALLLGDDAFKPHLPLLFDFLGAAEPGRAAAGRDADAFRQLLVRVLATLLRERAGALPALGIIEDLHWLDAASDAVVRDLVAALADAPVLLVLDYRPQYEHRWLRDAGARLLSLAPLPPADLDALLDDLLGADASLAALRQRLRARAAGNPFFAEELVRSLVQSGALAGTRGGYRLVGALDDGGIPTTVQAVLAARIDRLAAADKEVLQTAAVIGKAFAPALLAAVSGLGEAALATRLAALADAELIAAADASGALYVFRHPLTQEVAYATQLHTQRAAVHGLVARALAARAGETASADAAALLAYHFEAAGDAVEAALWHHRVARALAGTASREAVDRLRRAAALLRTAAESDVVVDAALRTAEDLIRLGSTAGLPGPEGTAAFAAGRALAERHGRRAALVQLLTAFADFQMLHGHSAEADACLREAGALARDVGDPAVRLGIALDRAQTAFWAGRPQDALAHLEEAEPLLGATSAGIEVGLQGPAFLYALRGMAMVLIGRIADGFAFIDRAEAIADAHGSLDGRCIARVFHALAANIAGAGKRALAVARVGRELAVRSGNPLLMRMADAIGGAAMVLAGQVREGIAHLEPATDAEAGLGLFQWYGLPLLADAYRACGEMDRALALAARGAELARGADALTAELSAQLALAPAAAAVGDAARARDALARAATLIERSGAESFRPRVHFAAASVCRAGGDVAGCAAELARGQALCRALGMDELADLAARELAGEGREVR